MVDPESGRLAGGDVGAGRLADPVRIVATAADVLSRGRDLAGVRVLVTAGGTREAIDPVRFVGNRSSGKMGFAVAEVAASRGAAVTLVTTQAPPASGGPETGPIETVRVESAEDMHREVLARFPDVDVVVMAAAVADFRPKAIAPEKLKKRDGLPEIVLEPTPDILGALGASKTSQLLVGFAAETERVEEHAAEKLAAKRLDLIVANDVSAPDAGFEVDTNRAVLLDSSGATSRRHRLLSKAALAGVILDRVAARMGRGTPGPQAGTG